jgi:HlyD family secretion protein
VSWRRVIAIVLLLAGGGAAWWWYHRAADPPIWQGYADADYVKVGPTQQGLLTSLAVARGDPVKVGDPLFTQDETSDRAARDQAARLLAQAEEQLANLEASGKKTEIQQAIANLADARATRDRTKLDLDRNETLLRTNVVSIQAVDQARAAFKSSQAKVEVAEAALAQMQAPMGRDREIEAQRRAVDAARAAVAMAQWRLDQRTVTAPVAGRVADVLARPGETLAAGAPVVSLLPPENILVRFFVPETVLATLHRGDAVMLTCDACPPDLSATISFVSPQAEYTPPVIYSESSRAKLVYLIEARPRPDKARLLNPGQPVEVHPAAARPAS